MRITGDMVKGVVGGAFARSIVFDGVGVTFADWLSAYRYPTATAFDIKSKQQAMLHASRQAFAAFAPYLVQGLVKGMLLSFGMPFPAYAALIVATSALTGVYKYCGRDGHKKYGGDEELQREEETLQAEAKGLQEEEKALKEEQRSFLVNFSRTDLEALREEEKLIGSQPEVKTLSQKHYKAMHTSLHLPAVTQDHITLLDATYETLLQQKPPHPLPMKLLQLKLKQLKSQEQSVNFGSSSVIPRAQIQQPLIQLLESKIHKDLEDRATALGGRKEAFERRKEIFTRKCFPHTLRRRAGVVDGVLEGTLYSIADLAGLNGSIIPCLISYVGIEFIRDWAYGYMTKQILRRERLRQMFAPLPEEREDVSDDAANHRIRLLDTIDKHIAADCSGTSKVQLERNIGRKDSIHYFSIDKATSILFSNEIVKGASPARGLVLGVTCQALYYVGVKNMFMGLVSMTMAPMIGVIAATSLMAYNLYLHDTEKQRDSGTLIKLSIPVLAVSAITTAAGMPLLPVIGGIYTVALVTFAIENYKFSIPTVGEDLKQQGARQSNQRWESD